MPKYKITPKYGQPIYKEFKNTYQLISYCDRYFRDDYEAEEYNIETERNQSYADLIEENSYQESWINN